MKWTFTDANCKPSANNRRKTMLIVIRKMRIKNLVINKDNEDNYLSLRMWLFMADSKQPRSRHCLMLGGRSLYNLAPKLAIENLKLSFDSLSPSLLPNLVSLFNFFWHKAFINNRDKFVNKFEEIWQVKIAITASDDVDVVFKPSRVLRISEIHNFQTAVFNFQYFLFNIVISTKQQRGAVLKVRSD